jgi:hypothetical protein
VVRSSESHAQRDAHDRYREKRDRDHDLAISLLPAHQVPLVLGHERGPGASHASVVSIGGYFPGSHGSTSIVYGEVVNSSSGFLSIKTRLLKEPIVLSRSSEALATPITFSSRESARETHR